MISQIKQMGDQRYWGVSFTDREVIDMVFPIEMEGMLDWDVRRDILLDGSSQKGLNEMGPAELLDCYGDFLVEHVIETLNLEEGTLLVIEIRGEGGSTAFRGPGTDLSFEPHIHPDLDAFIEGE